MLLLSAASLLLAMMVVDVFSLVLSFSLPAPYFPLVVVVFFSPYLLLRRGAEEAEAASLVRLVRTAFMPREMASIARRAESLSREGGVLTISLRRLSEELTGIGASVPLRAVLSVVIFPLSLSLTDVFFSPVAPVAVSAAAAPLPGNDVADSS